MAKGKQERGKPAIKVIKKDFVLSLEDNAKDSLTHAVTHFLGQNPMDLKYTILHVFHAIELFLKARLAKEHPILIYEKPEEAKKDNAKTASFDQLIARLVAIDVQFSKDDIATLQYLRKVRNSIEHHHYKGHKSSVTEYVGKAIRFIESFLFDELSLELKDLLDGRSYTHLQKAVYTYEERVERAKEKMENELPGDKDRLNHTIAECPNCGEETIAFPDPRDSSGNVGCFFCNKKFYAAACLECNDPILSSEPFSEENIEVHDACFFRKVHDDNT